MIDIESLDGILDADNNLVSEPSATVIESPASAGLLTNDTDLLRDTSVIVVESEEGRRMADNIRERVSPVVVLSVLGSLMADSKRVTDESATVISSAVGTLTLVIVLVAFAILFDCSARSSINVDRVSYGLGRTSVVTNM
jgi:hypothetical protein